jgi:serine/threonine-protein kinase
VPDAPTVSNVLEADTSMAGTLAYRAPEVLGGEPATAASDLWALGVLLYELSGGSLPFSGRTPFDPTAAIPRGTAPALPAHVPAGVRMIVSRCLAREPGERYRSAGEVRAATPCDPIRPCPSHRSSLRGAARRTARRGFWPQPWRWAQPSRCFCTSDPARSHRQPPAGSCCWLDQIGGPSIRHCHPMAR